MASYSRRKNKAILLHGKELKLAEPKGRLSLAYRGIEEVPMDVFVRPSFVKILDLSFNKIVYPPLAIKFYVCYSILRAHDSREVSYLCIHLKWWCRLIKSIEGLYQYHICPLMISFKMVCRIYYKIIIKENTVCQ